MSTEPHGHAHAHGGAHHHHDHAHVAAPPLSLLRMSLVERLAGASAVVVAIWLAVFWALR
jgi:hypothetical protein